MSVVPLRTVTLVSDLDPPALAVLLRQAIGGDPGQPFSGAANDGGFVITRLREYRSTFMPVLRGTFALAPGGGTRVRLRLSPPAVVILFMAVWLGFLGAVAALIAGARALGGGRSLLWLLAPGALAGLSWHVMASVFAADARWALQHLLDRVPGLTPDGPRL